MEITLLKTELERLRVETQAAVLRSAEKDQMIEQHTKMVERQAKTIEKQANEIAFHIRLHRLRQNAVSTRNVSDPTQRNQTAVARRTQASGYGGSSLLKSARVGPDRSVKACAVHPCELSDGICQNGGTCVEEAAEDGGSVPFQCQCVGFFGGDRCELHPAAMTTDLRLDTTDTTSLAGLGSDYYKWSGGVLGPDGRVYGIPYKAEAVLVVDPAAMTTDTTSLAGLGGGAKWFGGVLGPDGRVYGMPSNAEAVVVVDPTAMTTDTTSLAGLGSGGAKWFGGVLGPDGRVYGMPSNAEAVLVVE
eukprot:SAG22_NODE_1325_length_4736_cov_5.253397_4_plen_303_part_00